jgi:UDP-N-acetylglucosamine 2-epimerase (non-hydrolysing)
MKTILFVFGTRPEGIKLAPLINKFKADNEFKVVTCVTSQHKQMLMQVIEHFNLAIDFDLQIMMENQTLDYILSKTVASLENVFEQVKPDLTIVQGDATSSLAGAISSFHHKIPIAHIEAGLRTFDKYFPYPEEINRCLISHLADYHFAPTTNAANNLRNENIPSKNIFVVGNTTIDSQLLALEFVKRNEELVYKKLSQIDFTKKLILVTCHRRENFGEPLIQICNALNEIVKLHSDVLIVFPVHLNPNIRNVAYSLLQSPKIILLEPLDYPSLQFLMLKSLIILSDSGGIQEEAPTLGKPVLVLREKTERVESVNLGISKVVGTKKENILHWVNLLLTNDEIYKEMARKCFPYGDGKSSERIYQTIKKLIF